MTNLIDVLDVLSAIPSHTPCHGDLGSESHTHVCDMCGEASLWDVCEYRYCLPCMDILRYRGCHILVSVD